MSSLLTSASLSFPFLNQVAVLLINTVGLGIIMAVAIRNTFRDKLTSVFVTMGILMFLWIDFAYLARAVGSQNLFWSELFLRIAWVATPPFFAYVYLITVHMLGKERQLATLNNTLLVISLVLSFFTAFSDFVIQGVVFTDGNLDIQYGSGFLPFLGVISLFIAATLIPIFRSKLEDHRRRRVRIFLTGVFVFYAANLIFNIALPAFFGVTHLYYFGDYSLLFIVGFTAYAILRYRLLDIRSVIFRSVGFTLLTGSFFVLYGAILYSGIRFIEQFNFSTRGYAILTLANVVVAIPAYSYFRGWLRRFTNRFLFQNKVDYRLALVRLSQELSATIDINEVTRIMLRAMGNIVRAGKVVIMLQESHSRQFKPYARQGAPDFNVTIDYNYALVQHVRHEGGPLVKDQLLLESEQAATTKHREEIELARRAFEWLDIEAVVPLYVNRQMTGLILLGAKLTGEPYLLDDVEFLSGVAPQAAVALENARLYQESLEFSERLKEEVQRATHELEVANEQLKDLDKAKSEFLSIASHQLYTPLTAIRGYLSMIQEGDFGEIADKQKPVFDILNKSAVRLIELIKNLLDISRIESGRLELNLESIDLTEMAKELVQDLMPNAMAKKLDLQFVEPTEPMPHVVVDQGRLRQVMLNFIDNAIKYTDRGRIRVTLTRAGDEITFAVSDTGKGITREEIKRLFTKFTRVGGASKYHTEGTGLGLYVARQIVREHHGEVEVTSPGVGKGSTFSMRLPIEGSARSLKLGDHATVEIKAAETQQKQAVAAS